VNDSEKMQCFTGNSPLRILPKHTIRIRVFPFIFKRLTHVWRYEDTDQNVAIRANRIKHVALDNEPRAFQIMETLTAPSATMSHRKEDE
jgi:hypothetical protein